MSSGTEARANFAREKQFKDNVAGFLFIAPTLIGFTLFIGGPILLSAFFSFFDYNMIQDPKFVGFDNINRVLSDKLSRICFQNTFKFLIILVPVHCGLGLLLAYFVYKARGKLQFFYRSAIYFPSIVTTASVAIVWGFLFATDTGIINFFVRRMGGAAIPWLTNQTTVYVTIALFSFWKFIGVTFLYYFIGLQNIPSVYYEAAEIDGSGSVRTFFKITLPLLTPTLFFVIITNMIGVFQIFDEPFLLTNGGPGDATRTVALQIYDVAFRQMKIGYGTAISFALFLIILVITIAQFAGQKRWVTYDYE